MERGLADRRGAARQQRRLLLLTLLAPLLFIVALGESAPALTPLPFTPAFAERVESTFFENGALSEGKVASYRGGLALRRSQVMSVFVNDQRARGRKRAAALLRAERRKVVRLYDVLLGSAEGSGWIAALANEKDPVAARTLAGRILEMDYALKVEGHPPFSKFLPEHLPAVSVLYWSIPDSTRADDAAREATNLVDPASGLFYERSELRALIEQDADLSRLHPPPESSWWRDPGAISAIDVERTYHRVGPPAYRGLEWLSPERVIMKKVRKTQTKPKFEVEFEVEGKMRKYKLKVGGEINSEPVTGALLTALGFNGDLVKHVKNMRVDMGDLTEEEIRREWRSYFEFQRVLYSYSFDDYFEIHHDQGGPYMIVKEGSLMAYPEPVVRVGPWPWGALGNEGLREVRALSLFNIWVGNTDVKEAENNKLLLRQEPQGERLFHVVHDLGQSFGRIFGEQLEVFPWDVVLSHRLGRIRFDHKASWQPTARHQATFADARWMGRLIAQLTREQIAAAVQLGGWPGAAAALLTEKLVYRRNRLVAVLGLLGEQTPSGPIALLPVDRHLTTADGAVVDGTMLNGKFEGATREYANYFEELAGPIWEQVKLTGAGTFQGLIGSIPSVVFDSESADISKFVLLELLLNIRREVDENPRPTGNHDLYLVTDTMKLGLRLGAGLFVRGSSGFYRSYTLVQPAPTLREAHYAGDTILDVGVRRRVKSEELPPEFTLVRESYLDGRVGWLTEDSSGSVPVVGAQGGVARVRLGRSVVSRRRGELRAWRDMSKHLHADIQAFLNLVFFRIPLARADVDDGKLAGRLWTLPADEVAADPALGEAVSRLLRDDDFTGLEARHPGLPLRSRFHRTDRWMKVPIFFGRGAGSRRETIEVGEPVRETLDQYRTDRSGYWTFLDWGEAFRHVIRATASDAADKGRPSLVSTYYQRDRDTSDEEFGNAYLRFINGLPGRSGNLVDFDPSLHSVNGRWGDLEVKVRVGYSPKAVRQLRSLDPEAFWRELAVTLGVRPTAMARYRRALDVPAHRRQRARYQMPTRVWAHLLRAERLVSRLEKARAAEDEADWMVHVTDALGQASFRRGGWYDPTLLSVLHRMIGRRQISIHASILPPPFVENRLVGHTPIRARSRKKQRGLSREPIELDPQCAPALWEMLETFPTESGGKLAWPEEPPAGSGSPCDGSWGAFTR